MVSHADHQPVRNHAGDGLDLLRDLLILAFLAKEAQGPVEADVDDGAAVRGDVGGLAATGVARVGLRGVRWPAPQVGVPEEDVVDLLRRGFPVGVLVGRHGDGKGPAEAPMLHLLERVRDDDPGAGEPQHRPGRHELRLARLVLQDAPRPREEGVGVVLEVDLRSLLHGHIDPRAVGGVHHLDALEGALGRGRPAPRQALDPLELPVLEVAPGLLDDCRDRGARPEPDSHVVFDELIHKVGREALPSVFRRVGSLRVGLFTAGSSNDPRKSLIASFRRHQV
mmetsp:Transcript_11024/g.26142  ORF Transcript_11024/g.26142 Transcript_11024/m.26142 type:complete len:281 (-) Transcript_11024:222-1064(-)